jgi:hypothetical protein
MQRKALPLIVAIAALFASIAGNLVICWHSWQFYVGMSALPPGSEIRLIGRGIDSLLVSSVTFVVAMPLSIAGVMFSIRQHRVSTALVSFAGVVLTLTPFPLAYWLDGRIIAATGITLAQ